MNDPTDVLLSRAEELLGYRFEERHRLLTALTHRSWAHEHPDDEAGHNERLEFLGDAILGFIAARELFHGAPDAPEGELTRRRAAFVSAAAIASHDGPRALAELVRVGKGAEKENPASLPSVVADLTEAVIAAVFLDGGLDAAAQVIETLLGVPPQDAEPEQSAKSVLQERLQKIFGAPPGYITERLDGPDHAPVFRSTVVVGQTAVATAEGPNKKQATQAAASVALEELSGIDDHELAARFGPGPPS